MTLDKIGPGSPFVITRVTARGEIRARLMDMGFIGGARGTVLRKALLGDPIELKLGAYLVSLRLEEARNVHVSEPS
jgi:ferrous iron transport protein A